MTPRYTIQLVLRDNQSPEKPISMAITCDEALRISHRTVDQLKMGVLGSMDQVVEVMKVKEFRRRLFREITSRLAAQMADRLEDAEGWHDPERIDPARDQLGGYW
jgi:hypothetical protein